MELNDFYAHLLGLAPPWKVKSVASRERADEVDVYLDYERTALFPCPGCGLARPACDRSPVQTWRHLDTCGRTTRLHAELPVVDCPEHGRQSPGPPWGEAGFPVTFAFERLVAGLAGDIGDMRKTARLFGVEPGRVRRILRRARMAAEIAEAEKTPAAPAGDTGGTEVPPPARQPRQLPLFAQNDLSFMNRGIQAYRAMELDEAVELFRRHRQTYPDVHDVGSWSTAAEFLLDGMREAPREPRQRAQALCGLWDALEDRMESERAGRSVLAAEVKRAFFCRVIEELDRHRPPDAAASSAPAPPPCTGTEDKSPGGDVPSMTEDSSSGAGGASPEPARPARMGSPVAAPDVSPARARPLASGAAGASLVLPGDIPVGYVLLHAGRYDEAIRSLQNSIPEMPRNAAVYGYLGDAYRLRGDRKTARQCYLEACLIDPAEIDWRHLQDEDLKELKRELSFDYGSDQELAAAWLPSHARLEGIFEPKVVRVNDGLKEMADVYLEMEKAWTGEKNPILAAKLFFRGMILCENEENLRFVKKIDLVRIRRVMKEANPVLFGDFMETIAGKKRSR